MKDLLNTILLICSFFILNSIFFLYVFQFPYWKEKRIIKLTAFLIFINIFTLIIKTLLPQ